MRKVIIIGVLLLSMACRAAGQTVVLPFAFEHGDVAVMPLEVNGKPERLVIVGIKDTKTLQSFQNMLRAVGVPKSVTQIIVGNTIEFEKARKAFGIQDSHPAFSVYNMGRVYIPNEVLNNTNLIDKYLLHEFGHYAASAIVPGSQQSLSQEKRMALEAAAEKGAQPFRDAYKLYCSPQGRAYQAEQSRIDSDAGKIQPTSTTVRKRW